MLVLALVTHFSISCSVGLVPSARLYRVRQTGLRRTTATLWTFVKCQIIHINANFIAYSHSQTLLPYNLWIESVYSHLPTIQI